MPQPLDLTRFPPPDFAPGEEQRLADREALNDLLLDVFGSDWDVREIEDENGETRLRLLGRLECDWRISPGEYCGESPVQQAAGALLCELLHAVQICLKRQPTFILLHETIDMWLSVDDPRERDLRVKVLRRLLEEKRKESDACTPTATS